MSLKSFSQLRGVSLSRVNQMKATLPIVEFEGINQPFINISELNMREDVQQEGGLKFNTREPLSTLDLTQLGDYFKSLIARLTKQQLKAEQHRQHTEDKLAQTREEFTTSQQEAHRLQTELEQAQASVTKLQKQIDQLIAAQTEASHRAHDEQEALRAENNGLRVAVETLSRVLDKQAPKPGKSAKAK